MGASPQPPNPNSRFMKVAAIIPAAGLGTRMGRSGAEKGLAEKSGTSRKQFMLLNGAPVLMHTIRKFLACAAVNEILVALRQDDLDWFRGQLGHQDLSRPVNLVVGGEYRQESVKNGLARVAPGVDLVAVHDAVRPFVSVELIEKVIAEAASTGAAIL